LFFALFVFGVVGELSLLVMGVSVFVMRNVLTGLGWVVLTVGTAIGWGCRRVKERDYE